jgi:NAD-dependent dihydropyrimidine dehydrogenase PreA subunit
MKNIILRDTTQRKSIHPIEFNHLEVLKNIQLNQLSTMEEVCLKEIRKKHSGYKSQDKLKHKYDESQHITLTELIDKMVESQLKCYYCNRDLLIVYNKKKESIQWTLERLNNNIGHYKENTCISCLKCNLGRRTENYEYYKKGKTMILQKLI